MCQKPMIMKLGSLFQIPSTKPCETPPSGEITMTLYPVGNKTSLSRKLCIRHGHSFRIRNEKSGETPPKTMHGS